MAHRFIHAVYSICCDHQTELSPFVYLGEGKLNSVEWAIYFGSTMSLVVDYGVTSVECLEQDVDTPGQYKKHRHGGSGGMCETLVTQLAPMECASRDCCHGCTDLLKNIPRQRG